MNKTEKIRYIYAVFLGVFVVAMGIALICEAADIYYSGQGTGVIFTREIVGERLTALAIPFIILVGFIIVGSVFPLMDVRAKFTPENSVRLLKKKVPDGGSGEEYDKAAENYKKLCNIRLIIWLVTGAVLLGCTVAVLVYMFNTANFPADDITQEIFKMVQNVLPWIAVAFAALIAAAILSGINAKQRFAAMKQLIKYGNGEHSQREETVLAKINGIARNDITLWVVRGVVFALAVSFIIAGVCNGGAHDVLVKAINICTECIGLG